MKPAIGISDKNRERSAEILNRLLSDEFLLYAKTRSCHWNVTGPCFSELHKFFESQYQELENIVDETAERARALGVRAFGTLAEFLKHARLKESSSHEAPAASAMIKGLLADHEAVIRNLRDDLRVCAEKLDDMGTSDFLTGLMEQHEKMAWMLRSFLE